MGHKCFLIWGDWLSCDPLRGSHDSQGHDSQGRNYSYHIRGDRSPLRAQYGSSLITFAPFLTFIFVANAMKWGEVSFNCSALLRFTVQNNRRSEAEHPTLPTILSREGTFCFFKNLEVRVGLELYSCSRIFRIVFEHGPVWQGIDHYYVFIIKKIILLLKLL